RIPPGARPTRHPERPGGTPPAARGTDDVRRGRSARGLLRTGPVGPTSAPQADGSRCRRCPGRLPGPARRAPAPQRRPPARSAPGALGLPGLVCGNGHASSPERAVCRVCHAPLQGPTRTVARPPLGTIWTSYGERIVLDRTAILGRRPRASRVSAQDVPQLI